MSIMEQVITLGMVMLGTMLTRFLPFLVFPGGKKTPDYVQYLGKALPGAVLALLVIYCLKDVAFTSAPFGAPELISIALVVGLHLWKKNMFLSIVGGTAAYMLLVQLVFQ